MASQTIVVLLFALSVAHHAFGEVWEFGQDNPSSVVISHLEGDVLALEKSKRIQIPEPQCFNIDHVLVEVSNPEATPSVSFNKNTKEVTISYLPDDVSSSAYDIVAKGRSLDGCYDQNLRSLSRRYYGYGSGYGGYGGYGGYSGYGGYGGYGNYGGYGGYGSYYGK